MFASENDGINVLGALGIVFITLKLCGVITWSWWIVLLPFWGGLAVFFALVLVYLILLIVQESTK